VAFVPKVCKQDNLPTISVIDKKGNKQIKAPVI